MVGAVALLLGVVALVLVASLLPSVALAATVPGPPQDVRGLSTDFQAERVTVGWAPPVDDGGTPVVAYRVQASRDGVHWTPTRYTDCWPPTADPSCIPELHVTFSYELTIYATYVFRVAAYNDAGWGPWSDSSPPYTVLPGDQPRVAAPRNLVAVPVLRGMRVTWLPPANAPDASYVIEWSRDGKPWQGTVVTDKTSYRFRDLAYGDYIVRARSQRYEVEYSEWALAPAIVVPDRRQRVLGYDGLPTTLAFPGKTVIAPCGLMTNAGQRVRVDVRWELSRLSMRGSVDPVIVRKRACGKFTVTTTGIPVTVWVTMAAPAAGRYAEILRTGIYRLA